MKIQLQKDGIFLKLMRISITQLCLAIFCVGLSYAKDLHAQELLEKRISVRAEAKTIKNILSQIEGEINFKFVYSPAAIEAQRTVSINVQNQSVKQIFDSFFLPLNIKFRIVGNKIILSYQSETKSSIENKTSLLPNVESQKALADITVSGKVADEKGETLPGVSVILKGTSRGATTNVNGEYSISVPDNKAVLVFSFVGYNVQEIAVGNRSNIDVTLKVDTKTLDEVVVVGYGQQKKVSMTNAISTIKGTDLVTRPSSSMQQVLQGQAAGLTVLDQGGSPGRTTNTMRVRGITTLSNSNDALIIVDGIEQQLTNINPNDIENISVLKDAASTAIYGSRAANGVIMVTTKRAKEGKVSVSYSGFYTLQNSVNNPEMNLADYMKLQQVAYTNANIAVPARFTDTGIQEYIQGNKTNPELYPDVNSWYSTLLKRAPQINNNLSISGGNDFMKARLSTRYQKQASIIDTPTDYGSDLVDIRLNTDFKVSNRININADINYRNNFSFAPVTEGDIFNRILHGTLFATPIYSSALESQYPGITGTYGLSPQGLTPRIMADKDGTSKRWDENIFTNLKGDLQITNHLKFTSQLAIRLDNLNEKNFVNSYSNTDLVKNVTRRVVNNVLTETRNKTTEYTWNNFLNYENNFAKNDIKGLLGYSTINNIYNGLTASRQRFYNNDIQSISQGANDGTKDNTGFDAQFGLRSYFGRINYAYADKYLLEVNGRYDGSSRFNGDNKYSFFPSFSAGWRISEENFMKNSFFDELKLRASWGQTGNQSVGLYSFYQALASSAYGFNNASVIGFSPAQLANKNITWETTEQLDLGFDAQIFKSFTVGFDFYNKKTSGILLSLPIPATIGLTAPPQNAGIVQNKGVELQLGYRVITSTGFRYNTSANFAINRNKVLSLAGTGPYITGSDIDPLYIIKEGLPINSLWGYQTDGLFQTAEEVKNYPTITTGRGPGDVKYVDLNGDRKIDANDRTVIGKSFPDLMYSFNGNVGYKNFELTLFFQGAAGVDSRISGALSENGNNEGFVPKIVTSDYWTPTNTNARFPRPLKRDLFNMYTSDRLIINGNYLRLKNVQLLYNLPKSIINKAKMGSANVYLAATNLLTFSKLKEWGLDPEVGQGRAVYYPQIATITIGTNIQF